jgi:hypothetical protein
LPWEPRFEDAGPIEEKIVHLRLTYHFGPTRIAWYLGRYHEFSISTHGVYNVLVRNGTNRLPGGCNKRSMPSVIRYEKQVPGHHVQVDVKFLDLVDPAGRKVRRFQYTATDDATRIRALRVYEQHTQAAAVDFVDQRGTSLSRKKAQLPARLGQRNPQSAASPQQASLPAPNPAEIPLSSTAP